MEWIILGVIILLTVINVPIGYALAIATILAILWTGAASLSVVPLNLFSGASSFPLLAIPLFILAGGLMETGGISQRLVNLANSLVGFIRGGLAMVTVVATMIQSEISGSSVADAAAIGKVVIPSMEKRGYPRALSAAIVSNAASAAILIPPSIPMIIYAWMAEVSIAKLFFAGFLFTAGPRWLGVPQPSARDVLPSLLLQAGGWMLWLAGAHLHVGVALGGLALAVVGLASATLRFWGYIYKSDVPDRLHAKSIGVALAIGCASLAGVGTAEALGAPDIARQLVLTGLWGFVTDVPDVARAAIGPRQAPAG